MTARLAKSRTLLPALASLLLMLGCTGDDEPSGESSTDVVREADDVGEVVSDVVGCTLSPAEITPPSVGVPAPRRSLRCESANLIVMVHEYDSVNALGEMIAATDYCNPHIEIGRTLVEGYYPGTQVYVGSNGASLLPADLSDALGGVAGRC